MSRTGVQDKGRELHPKKGVWRNLVRIPANFFTNGTRISEDDMNISEALSIELFIIMAIKLYFNLP